MTCWIRSFETKWATDANGYTCKNELCQICNAVAELDDEISQALDGLRRLITKRCNLRSEQNRAHDPMYRLPVELKNYIFELLLPSSDEWGEIPRTQRTIMPSYWASICRGWRDIVWSNPFLWSTMHIVLGSSNTTSDPSNFVHNWTLRSRTLPLTFHIQVVDRAKKGVEQSRKALAPVLDVMSQCSNRLQSLSLDDPFSVLSAFRHHTFQWHSLTRLRIVSSFRSQTKIDQSQSSLNSTASPERVELRHISCKSLQISWNRLSCATVRNLDLEGVTHLFQHAPQMTDCHISSLVFSPTNFSMPTIIHHRLETFTLRDAQDWDVSSMLLEFLTLPCLQEFHTDEMALLIDLPALAHRSSCPLTRLTLHRDVEDEMFLDDLQPLPGVTDLVLESLRKGPQAGRIKKLLLEEYFPDLRRITLRLQPFLSMWDIDFIPLFLLHERSRFDGLNQEKRRKLLVVERDQDSEFERMWRSEVGRELQTLGAILREDGFEFL